MAARVLIVEDESIVALDLRNRLDALGFEVAGTARTAKTALELTRSERPDLVLMDINLHGEVDGIDIADEIQAELSIPVVFLTAFSDTVSLQRASRARASGYLLKPFHERELSITIQLALYKHQMERRLAEQQQLLETTLNTVPEGIVTIDEDGRVMLLNPAAEKVTGWQSAEAEGTALEAVVALESLALDPELAPDAADWHTLRRRDGTALTVEVSRIELPAPRPGKAASVILLRDVTMLRTQQRALLDARRTAEQASRAKAAFLARISHELKTPLNSIIGMAEVSEGAVEDPQLKQNLGVILAAGRSLARMVESLLDFTTLDTHTIEPAHEPIVPVDVVGEVIRRVYREAAAPDISVTIEADPRLPGRVLADRRRITQILAHLVSNAIKFTGHGAVVVAVRTYRENHLLELEVRDTGRGIDSRHLDTVFDSFAQEEAFTTRSVGGAGIGLAVVHRLVSALGGTVDIESERGHGTRIVVQLPYREDPSVPELAEVLTLERTPTTPDAVAADSDELAAALAPWCAYIGVPLLDAAELQVRAGRSTHMLFAREEELDRLPSELLAGRTVVVLRPCDGPDTPLNRDTTPALLDTARVVALREPIAPEEIAHLLAGRLSLLPGAANDHPADSVSPTVARAGLRVLVVDDDPLNRLVLRTMLADLGITADEASDAREALASLASREFDAVFTDIRMAEIDGIQLAGMIREGAVGERTRRVRIVAVSAYDDPEIQERAFAHGVDRCLVKPVSSHELQDALTAANDEWSLLSIELDRLLAAGDLERVAERARAVRARETDLERGEVLFRLSLAARRGDAVVATQLVREMAHVSAPGPDGRTS